MDWVKSNSWIEAVNQFWFRDLGPSEWFGGGARIDAVIRDRFAGLRDELKKNPPSGEQLESQGLVAARSSSINFRAICFGSLPKLTPRIPWPWHSQVGR